MNDKKKAGPTAWASILTHFDRDASKTKFNAAFFSNLSKAVCMVKAKHLSFESYLTLTKKAHAEVSPTRE